MTAQDDEWAFSVWRRSGQAGPPAPRSPSSPVHPASPRAFPYRNLEGPAEVDGFHSPDHSFSGFHSDATHAALTQVLLHLENHAYRLGDIKSLAGNPQRLVDGRQIGFCKLHV